MSDERRPGSLDSHEWDDPAFYEALGRAIKVLRTERGIERKELADGAGVSYPYLSEIENGKKRASSKALLAIAEALGIRPFELLEQAERLLVMDRGYDILDMEPLARAQAVETLSLPPASREPARRLRRRTWFRREDSAPAVAAAPEAPNVPSSAAFDETFLQADGAPPAQSRPGEERAEIPARPPAQPEDHPDLSTHRSVAGHLSRILATELRSAGRGRVAELLELASDLEEEDLDRLIDLALESREGRGSQLR